MPALVATHAILVSFAIIVQISPAAADPAPHLIKMLKSKDPIKRENAAYALGKTRDPRALTPLLQILQDPSENGQVRMTAAMSLGLLGDINAVAPLIEILRFDMEMRTGILAGCIVALGELKDPRAVPVLLEVLNIRADDWIYREMAVRALGDIGDAGAVNDLISAAYMADTRHEAIEALAKIGDAKASEIFIGALDENEKPDTVHAATEGLLKIGSNAVPLLIQEMENFSKEYPRSQTRSRVSEILGKICDIRARETLLRALTDPSPLVRNNVRQALDRIEDCR